MAPPKTMAISQQQQPQQQSTTLGQQQQAEKVKPRKRKAKQTEPSQQVNNSQPILQEAALNGQSADSATAGKQQQQHQHQHQHQHQQQPAPANSNNSNGKTAPVVPSERTTIKKQQQQVPTLVKDPIVLESKRALPAVASLSPTSIIGKHQQLVNEEADDIDAGIELDGSSNSGSSVKDMSEDQTKSTSVSPVMAQSNLINEHCTGSEKQAIEVAPLEQIAGSLCSPTSPKTKKISTTKQQLAANQQVIDADEQLLQQKLQNKQRKSSLQQQDSTSPKQDGQTPNKQQDQATTDAGGDDKSARVRRRFSSQNSQESQDGSLCKVCDQHVYQMERMLAEKSVYHKRCFRCHQCKIQLRVDNYSSHEGLVYCKAHHRQIFQPQVKLDNEDDVDIVAKSTSKTVDDYLKNRGRLSELSFSFLQPKPEGIQKRQMIICENEPAELPKDVVRSDTKLDDGIDQLNLNLNNILEKFERGTASNGEESQPSSAGVVIEKPSFNLRQTLMAFESRLGGDDSGDSKRPERATERPVVRKLTNLSGFLNRESGQDGDQITTGASNTNSAAGKPLAVRRSESLMLRLKKYESRIAGEQVDDDDEDGDDEDENNNEDSASELSASSKRSQVPKKLTSINLSSLKSQWENGDISKRRIDDDDDDQAVNSGVANNGAGDNNNNSPLAEKNEELCRIRQQLARKKMGESGPVKNIYENAIREAQIQQQKQQASSRRDSSDLSALNGFSTTDIQQQLLQNSLNGNNGSANSQTTKTPTTPNKDHFQLNLSNKANKLKEKFELGLINNSSHDDSDLDETDEAPVMTKLEQIRQEKLEDLSVFTHGEIKAREARSLFQQIDSKISAASGNTNRQPLVSSRSLASIGASMRTKLTNQMNANGTGAQQSEAATNNHQQQQHIRLTNNVSNVRT